MTSSTISTTRDGQRELAQVTSKLNRPAGARAATGLPLDVLEGYGTVSFSPDGAHLAISSSLGYARVWDTATWREEATLRGFLNAVSSVAFSPDGSRLATTGANPEDAVRLWDVDSWQELITLQGEGTQFSFTSFSPDGIPLKEGGENGFIALGILF